MHPPFQEEPGMIQIILAALDAVVAGVVLTDHLSDKG